MFNTAAAVRSFVPAGARGMATLKQISTRLKSVKSIQKITKSMKMVSAAKFSRAERQLQGIRPLGGATMAMLEKSGVDISDVDKKKVIVPITSDRGLCGGIHSGIAKTIRAKLAQTPADVENVIVPIGDKQRALFARTHKTLIAMSANELGRRAPTFDEAVFLAQNVLAHAQDADSIHVFYNKYKSAVSFAVDELVLPTVKSLEGRDELNQFDEIDNETLQSYTEFHLASAIYYALVEGQAAEQSSRMSAMEAASTNAGDMIDSLQLAFNRTRQAVITRELIEIISGAAALE